MRHTIIIATLSSVAALVATTAVISGSLFGAGTASSANIDGTTSEGVQPGGVESVLQGDINCDGVVDTQDALGTLRYVGGLDVQQDEPCPNVGTLAAIPGPQGPAGPAGPAGQPGISGLVLVTESSGNDGTDVKVANAPCPDGKQAIGGGATIFEPLEGILALTSSSPWPDLGGWGTSAEELSQTGSSWRVEASAICANVAE